MGQSLLFVFSTLEQGMSPQLLFMLLSAVVWPIVHLLFSFFAVIVGLLFCTLMVGWWLLRARQPGTPGDARKVHE